jgi:hypothetical protein
LHFPVSGSQLVKQQTESAVHDAPSGLQQALTNAPLIFVSWHTKLGQHPSLLAKQSPSLPPSGSRQAPPQQTRSPPQPVPLALFLITHVPVFVQTRCLHGSLAGGEGHWLARRHGWQVPLPAHRPVQH